MTKGSCKCTPECANCYDDCKTLGQCLRGKSLHIGYAASARGLDATREKKWQRELDLYKEARSQGIQPATTKTADIRQAIDISNKTGVAFDAGSGHSPLGA